MTLGINVATMSKILKCAGAEDSISLSAMDNGEVLTFTFRGPKERVAEYEMKLMNIDAEQLGVPEQNYDGSIEMSSAEFLRICRDLTVIGENLKISLVKDAVTFSVEGELGNGSITLKPNASVDDNEGEETTLTINQPVSLD